MHSCGAWLRRRREGESAANVRVTEALEAGAKWRLERYPLVFVFVPLGIRDDRSHLSLS